MQYDVAQITEKVAMYMQAITILRTLTEKANVPKFAIYHASISRNAKTWINCNQRTDPLGAH
jgi:hypothetical protein